MRTFPLILLSCALGLSSGCNTVPAWHMQQAQLQTLRMYRQSQSLQTELSQAQQASGQLLAENQQLQQQVAIANQRFDNLNAERAALHERFQHLLTASQNPLPGSANQRFRDLAERYPDFEFDPETGVSKLNADLLFASGSDEVRSEASALLTEFVQILNESDAREFNILVVGHTDDRPIVQPGTQQRHPTNWELSAHRATSVVKRLAKLGMAERRMGIAGYSMYQPVAPNDSDEHRQLNRRVEIYVLAPDAQVALDTTR
jgi:chemotaxis protein MotB